MLSTFVPGLELTRPGPDPTRPDLAAGAGLGPRNKPDPTG